MRDGWFSGALAAFLASLAWAVPCGSAAPAVSGSLPASAEWSGEVSVVGQVFVRKGSTLTIRPGTTVRFAWVDADGDGIGDGELNVEGTLIARGTRERPIVFTSAREAPAPKDWTYVMISTSRDSVVEHCVFEYAFTGLQAHLSTLALRSCRFRRNFEGLRFSTVEIDAACCEFTQNTYGIRYESRGSSGTISGNDVVDNESGFFPVIRGTSAVRISGNNIVNREYNVKMGAEQREDLDYRGNWWGSATPQTIAAKLFDKRLEPTVGRVLFEPYLERAVEPCGIER